jgi:O-methyltransferase
LAGRADAVAGSFFDPLPKGAGGYLLCAVLHDWGDEPARAILRRCAEAAGTAGGRVFVVEKLATETDPRTEMDLRVLAWFGGRERSVTELTALAAAAGLLVAAVHPAGATPVVELTAG